MRKSETTRTPGSNDGATSVQATLQTGSTMMRKVRIRTLLFLAAVVFAAGPAAVQAQSVKVDFDHGVDFTRFKTYSWLKGRQASNPQIHKLIVDEIDRQLQNNGLKKVEGNADLNVVYYASLDENINTGAVDYVKNSDWKEWGDHNPVYGPKMVTMPIARMTLDIVDASANTLVWRGRAKDAYTPNQARGKSRVSKAVEKLFAKFPSPASR